MRTPFPSLHLLSPLSLSVPLTSKAQAATKLRTHFLSLLTPIRTSVTTNLAVLQGALFLRHRALYAFLQRRAPGVAAEVQRAYVGAARTYFETGFRRYVRSLGYIKVRSSWVSNLCRNVQEIDG